MRVDNCDRVLQFLVITVALTLTLCRECVDVVDCLVEAGQSHLPQVAG